VISYAPARAIATLMGGVNCADKTVIHAGLHVIFSSVLAIGARQFFP